MAIAILVGLALSLCGGLSTAESAGSRISDIVLITIDALRADHVGVYGYSRRTTPFLDAFSRQAIRFERAYTTTPHTSLAIGSLLTGRSILSTIRLTPERTYPTLPELLRRTGYRSVAFYPPSVFFTESGRLKHYEEKRFGFDHVVVDYFDAMTGVAAAIDFLERRRLERTFVWLHLLDPHEPYEAHKGYLFGASDRDRYDSEIAYADAALGRLFDHLEHTRPDAAIIVTADHGEAFDEHGDRYHGTSLYEEQVRIPLWLKLPGQPARVVAGPVSLLDLAPTLLSLTELVVPPHMQGQPLMALTQRNPERVLHPVFAELANLRMVVSQDHKLLCDLSRGSCALYDLSHETGERTDRAARAPAVVAALRSTLERRLSDEASLFEKAAEPPDPRWTLIARAKLGDRSVAKDLFALLSQTTPPLLRREAARALSALPVPEAAADALGQALFDRDPEIAGWAAVAGVTLNLSAARAIARRLQNAPTTSFALRSALALALSEKGERAGLFGLIKALPACKEPLLCQRIAKALGRLRDERAMPALLTALPRLELRKEVVEALGEIADPKAAQPLVTCLLSDVYVPVRVAAARALGRLRDPAAREALLQAAERDTESVVVTAAKQAVAKLRPNK